MRTLFAAVAAILIFALLYAGLGYVTNASAAIITPGVSVQPLGPLTNTGR
jgi:hypothetical protein